MMEEELVEIAKKYKLDILHAEINLTEGYQYIFALSSNQIRHLQSCDLDNFEYRAKMIIVNNTNIPLGQIPGTYEICQNVLKLTGSIEYIFMMLKQIFD